MLDQHHDVGRAARNGDTREARYHRLMPGGGYVEIEVEQVSTGESARPRGRLIVERRAESGRRLGHQPPVVAEVMHDDIDALIAELFQLAHDNAALARSLMQWQSARAHAD
ncbi:MAG TPA: hypothetical protein VGP25_21625 [Gemmatimonadaceae bacterium]|jgi:hypothetical protein|nr:hypothetical protein [Gemmatimonadaceae bacterium]